MSPAVSWQNWLLCPSPSPVKEDTTSQPSVELFASPQCTLCRGFLDAQSGPAAEEGFFFFFLFMFLCDQCLFSQVNTDTLVSWGSQGTCFGCVSGWSQAAPCLTSYPRDESQGSAACPTGTGSRLQAFVSFRLALCWSCDALGINKPQPGFLQPAVAQGENERFVFLFSLSRADWWLN